MKRIILFILILLGLFTFWYYRSHPLTPTMTVNGTTFTLEVSVTNAEKMKGLSGRTMLAPKHGMIFLYDHKERYPFTMKGMNFPLDFVWLDGNVILDIAKNVPPDTAVILPSVAVDKVLELNAGEVDAASMKIGDRVLFNK